MAAHRNTRQRQIILDALASFGSEHMTAEALTQRVREADSGIGQATVYRYLRTLKDEGLIRKYTLPDGATACWQYIGEHSACRTHYHLKCSKCGTVMHIESGTLDNFSSEVLERCGFCVSEGETVFYGCCATCSAAREAE